MAGKSSSFNGYSYSEFMTMGNSLLNDKIYGHLFKNKHRPFINREKYTGLSEKEAREKWKNDIKNMYSRKS